MSKIYTGFGDNGKTRRLDGKIVKKNDPIIEVNGIIDECNSTIGIIRSINKNELLETILKKIQNKLFIAGAEVSSFNIDSTTKIKRNDIKEIEEIIDDIDLDLDKLSNFILPAGNLSSSHLHLARSVCRKIERSLIEINYDQHSKNYLLPFFNRLSDLFFVLARYANKIDKMKDEIWDNKN